MHRLRMDADGVGMQYCGVAGRLRTHPTSPRAWWPGLRGQPDDAWLASSSLRAGDTVRVFKIQTAGQQQDAAKGIQIVQAMLPGANQAHVSLQAQSHIT